MILYHGTNDKFNKFSKDKIGSNTGVTSVGFFFTDSYETAKSYGDIVLKCDVDLGNYIECDFNNTCHTFLIDKEYIPSELAVKIAELNKYLKSHSDIRGVFDIDLDIEYDEEDEPIYPDNYWDEYEIQDYIDSLGTYDHQCDDRIDSIICKNVKDNMGFGGNSCNNYIVFDEDRIKILEIVSDKNMNEEAYVYAHLEKNDYDEFEVFTDEVEVMIFSPNDNVQRLRQFLNDKGTLRCIIDKNIYLWDAHEATHGAMHDYLKNKFNCKYNYGNAFMFNSKHIDPTSLNDVLFHIEDGKEFLDNYKMLKELLGIDYDKYALTDLEKLKNKISLTEKFEEIADDMFATNSAYDIINQMKNKPKPIRLVYDKDINYYFIGDAYSYIHQDILEEAFYQGFYPDMLSSSEARDKVDNYEVLLFAFYPSENHRQDLEKSSDGYTRKYVYDFGTIYSHEMTPLEDFEIYNILGEPKKKETILENIYRKLNEELNNFF